MSHSDARPQRRARQRLRRPARHRHLAVGLRHRLRGPAGRRRHDRARTASTRPTLAAYCLMLGDDALVLLAPALASGAATRPTSRRTSRWPTSRSTCSARPGCCWPAPRPPTRPSCPALPEGSPVPAEDALAFFREAERLPQRPAGRGRATATSRTRSRGCCCSRPRGSRCSSGWPRTPRPGARRDRGQGRQGADLPPRLRRPLVPHPGPGHRGVASPAARGLTGSGRCTPSCSPPTVEACRGGVGVDPATVADEVDVVLDQVFAVSASSVPTRPAGRRRWRPAARLHTEALSPDARRDAGRRPRAPDGAVVSDADRLRASPATVTDPEMPMLTLEDLGVLRDVARGRRRGRRDDHPDVLRLPGDGHHARRPGAPAHRRRVRRRASRSRSARPGRATGSPSAAGRRCASTASPARARRRGPAARSPLTLLPTRRAVDLPAVRLGAHRADLGVRRRPPARRSTAARTASSRSST